MAESMVTVSLKCEHFHDNGNGTITLHFPGKALSSEEHRLIEALIPSRLDGFYKLLQEQTLLNMLATEADIMKPSKKDRDLAKK